MRRSAIITGLATAASIALLLPTAGASAAVRHCRPPTRIGSDNPANVGNVTARNMSCATVRRAIAHGHLIRSGGFRTRGFRCYLVHRSVVGGTVLGAQNRCVSGRRAFRFDWAT